MAHFEFVEGVWVGWREVNEREWIAIIHSWMNKSGSEGGGSGKVDRPTDWLADLLSDRPTDRPTDRPSKWSIGSIVILLLLHNANDKWSTTEHMQPIPSLYGPMQYYYQEARTTLNLTISKKIRRRPRRRKERTKGDRTTRRQPVLRIAVGPHTTWHWQAAYKITAWRL